MNLQSLDPSNPFCMFEVSKVCATCAKHLPEGSSYPLDTPVDVTATVNLHQILESQFQFKCKANGPRNLCTECFSKAILFYEFHQQYTKTAMLFNKYIEYQEQFTTPKDVVGLHIPDTHANSIETDEEQDQKLSIGPELIYIKDVSTLESTEEKSTISDVDVSNKTKRRGRKQVDRLTEKPNDDKKFKCTLCNAAYDNYHCYKQHKNVHERRYVCSFCGLATQNSYALRQHERTHTGERPYECRHCGCGFTTNYTLQQHLQTHTTFASHKCEVCGKMFKRIPALDRHMKVHTRPHKCSKCTKTFALVSSLNKHLKVCEKSRIPRVYECNLCFRTFSQSGTLRRHMRKC